MKVRRKIRKGLALFLAFAAVFTILAQDIRITRAEESVTGDLELSGSIGEEDILKEEYKVSSQGETEEGTKPGSDEEPEKEFPEETEEGTKSGSDEEPEKEFPEETEEGTKPSSDEEPEKESPENMEEGVPADSDEELKEDSEEESHEKPQEKDGDNQKAVFANEPSEETSYPVYVSSPTISIEGSLDGIVRDNGIRQRKDLEQTAGETATSQHCPLDYTYCFYCDKDIYITAPFLYGAVYASVSDSSVIQSKEYISGEWTDGNAIKDAGCLHVNYRTRKPGIADVKVYYYVRYQKPAGAKGRCPLCRGLMPSVNSSTWYKYEDDFKICVYADYSLRYDANAGADSVRNMPLPLTERKAASAAELEVTDLKPVREGYQFLGWAERKDAVKETYTANDLITLRWGTGSDVEKTLYAVWRKNVQYGPVTEDIIHSKPNLTVIKRACRPDTVTPVTSVETGEAYSYVITIKNNAKSKIEHLQVSELLDTNLIQLLNNPTNYKNGIWTVECLKAEETVSLILHVKAIAESPGYENVVHVMAESADQGLTEIPPGPDDIRSATVEIRAAPDPELPKGPEEPAPEPPEGPEEPAPEPPEGSEEPAPEPPEGPEEPDMEPPGELPSSSSGGGAEEEEGVSVQEPILIPERGGEIVSVTGRELQPVRPAAAEMISEQQPGTEEKTAVLKREPAEDMDAETDIFKDASDPGVPLAAHGHLCCILHLVIMLLTLIAELFYIRSMKKRQNRIFEIRKKLKENENRRREYA